MTTARRLIVAAASIAMATSASRCENGSAAACVVVGVAAAAAFQPTGGGGARSPPRASSSSPSSPTVINAGRRSRRVGESMMGPFVRIKPMVLLSTATRTRLHSHWVTKSEDADDDDDDMPLDDLFYGENSRQRSQPSQPAGDDGGEEEEEDHGKFVVATGGAGAVDDDEPLPPLPDFDDDFTFGDDIAGEASAPGGLDAVDAASESADGGDVSAPADAREGGAKTAVQAGTEAAGGDALRLKMEEQQRQIDQLMAMMTSSAAAAGGQAQPVAAAAKAAPAAATATAQSQPEAPPPQRKRLRPPEDGIYRPPKEYNPQDAVAPAEWQSEYTDTADPPATMGRSSPSTASAARSVNMNVTPLKAMLFIDGTWLYYSLHQRSERDDPILRRFGKRWQSRYRFDWSALPRIICERLDRQRREQGWSSSSSDENAANQPVEIARASVFTSYKKSTPSNSIRVNMFEDMSSANYDVHLMETVGSGEKCVDIQLAVEMLHYATVPGAYDVAILLSGDKDFMPALMRTRQKGKKVGIVSMRAGCNKALYETPNVKDFDVVWIDDFLDDLILPISTDELERRSRPRLVSVVTVNKLLHDFCTSGPASGTGRASSRDVGRFLKALRVGDDTNVLEELKQGLGGLRQFLFDHADGILEVTDRDADERGPGDNSYWIAAAQGAEAKLADEARKTNFTTLEREFLREYGATRGARMTESAYYHTVSAEDFESSSKSKNNRATKESGGGFDNGSYVEAAAAAQPEEEEEEEDEDDEPELILPPELTFDYSALKVAELKERCRARGLPVSGTKAVLLDRIEGDVERRIAKLRRDYDTMLEERRAARSLAAAKARRGIIGGGNSNGNADGGGRGQQQQTQSRGGTAPPPPRGGGDDRAAQHDPNYATELRERYASVPPEVTAHLEGLVAEYIQASGGKAGSRDAGRYLAANAASGHAHRTGGGGGVDPQTALKELKACYGTLANFVLCRDDKFVKMREDRDNSSGREYGFPIRLR